MDTTPYWLETAKFKKFPALQKDLEVDVLVVGGGITGLTSAYLLAEEGLKVALLERDRLATHDSGHTTAHLTCVTDTRLHELAKNFGRDAARLAWDAGMTAIDLIEAIVGKEALECQFQRVPGYLHAPRNGGTRDERPSLRKDAALANELGFDATYVEATPLMGQPGVRVADQALFHAGRYYAGLAQAMKAQIFEQTEVEEFDAEKHVATANGRKIKYDRVILATHNPLMGESGMAGSALFQTKLMLYTSYAVGAPLKRGTAPIASYWDTKDPYSYLRIHEGARGDYAILGGQDHKTGQVRKTEPRFRALEKEFRELFPGAEIDFRWSGQVIDTTDGLPYIGPNEERQFIATGFAGNGMTFGTISGLMARDWVTGAKNPWQELFAPGRKKLKGSAWTYLLENKDYPLHLIKGYFARAEGSSVRALKPGEGKILKLESGKVAAYRTPEGKVIKRSAVCPHMGCIVRWNTAETTWDCPCHGSRFQPTGEVIGGPAESPLAPL